MIVIPEGFNMAALIAEFSMVGTVIIGATVIICAGIYVKRALSV